MISRLPPKAPTGMPPEIVVGQGQRQVGQRLGHARGVRHAEGQGAGAGLHQQAVGVAVVAAFELDDAVAPGVAAGQTDGAHGRLGAGADHAHHLAAGHQRGDALGHGHFPRVRRAVGQPGPGRVDHRLAHLRMAVAEDHRAPGADIVDVAVAVDIEQVRPVRALDEERLAAHRLERAHRRIDAAGHQRLGAGEQVVRAVGLHVRGVLSKAEE